MQTETIRQNIMQKQFLPFYVLYGAEPYLQEDMKQLIIQEAVGEASQALHVSTYDMEESPIDAALEEADLIPLIGDRRVIIIENPIFLTGKTDKSKMNHDLTKLQRYIEDPSPYTIMVFTGDYEKLDQRKKMVRALKEKGAVLSFATPDEGAIFQLLNERAKKQGTRLTKEANERLLQYIGTDLFYLTSEVDKMALYVNGEGDIDDQVVALLSAKTLESNVFALVNSVVSRHLDEAFTILRDLLKQNEEPIKLLALLVRQFRIIFQVKEWTREGYSQGQISKWLKLHPYAVKVAADQAKSLPRTQLLGIINACVEADFMMKTGRMDKQLALELLLANLDQNKKTALM